MTTISESPLDYNGEVRSGFDWVLIPTEILYYIFRKLDVQSLRCCFAVNRKWKEVAENVCELQDLWKELAEDGIVNHGVTHHFKSTLSWKQLYFNSLLWNNLQSATINKVHEIKYYDSEDIKRIHVYRDKLIVVSSCGVHYYDVQSFTLIRIFSIDSCEDLQETDDMVMVVIKITTHHDYYEVTVYPKASKDESIDVSKRLHNWITDPLNTLGAACLWRIVGNNCYVIDEKSVLWKCSVTDEKLTINAMSRYYGIAKVSSMNVLTSIHVLKEEVFVTLIWGGMLVALKDMTFRKVNVMDIPMKVIRCNTNNQQPSGKEFNAVLTTPLGIAFRESSPQNLLHFYYEDPEMTCGLQHGDVVFRGFVDGRVEITVLRDGSKIDLHVKDLDKDVENPAVVSLEVCELEQKHMLFVATEVKLYALLVTYPESLLEN